MLLELESKPRKQLECIEQSIQLVAKHEALQQYQPMHFNNKCVFNAN